MQDSVIKIPEVSFGLSETMKSLELFQAEYTSAIKAVQPFLNEVKKQRESISNFTAPIMKEITITSKIFLEAKKKFEERAKITADILRPTSLSVRPLYRQTPIRLAPRYSRIDPIDINFIAEQVSEKILVKSVRNRTSYKLPDEAKWERLTIKVFDGHTIKIKYPRISTATFDYKDLGCEDGNSHKPDVKWQFLIEICNQGSITGINYNKKFSRNVRYELAERMKKFFDMKENPFYNYNKKDGYRPKFGVISEGGLTPFDEEPSFDID